MAWTDPATYSTSEVVTATKLNTHIRDNMKELWHEVAYVEFTADVTVTTASTEASPLDIVSSGAITYAALPTIIEFYCCRFQTPGTNSGLNLWDAATDLGRIAITGSADNVPVFTARRMTPTAASHTFKVRAWAVTSSSTVHAGAGGVGIDMPGFIRVLQRGG